MNQVAIVALPLTLYLRFAFTLKEDELMNLIDIAIAYETSNETMYLRSTYSSINYNDLKPKENCQPSKLNH